MNEGLGELKCRRRFVPFYWGASQDRLYSTAALQEILISVKVLTGPVFML